MLLQIISPNTQLRIKKKTVQKNKLKVVRMFNIDLKYNSATKTAVSKKRMKFYDFLEKDILIITHPAVI